MKRSLVQAMHITATVYLANRLGLMIKLPYTTHKYSCKKTQDSFIAANKNRPKGALIAKPWNLNNSIKHRLTNTVPTSLACDQ